MSINQKTVAVIGAGIAGIATSIRLANKGYKVHVFEANSYAGGKLSSFEEKGYRFDAGPSLFTMPHLVDELFRISGKNPQDYFEYTRLDEACRYFWDDGTRLTAHANQQDFAHEIEQKLGEPAAHVLAHLADSAVKYNVTEKLFLHRSLHKIGTYFNRDALKGYANLHRLDAFKTMNRANEQRFKNPRVVQLFNRYATYNGSDPYQTPATMNIIPHLEYNIGAFFPKKGMVDITESLVNLAKDLGVQFHFNTQVERIETVGNQAKTIQVSRLLHASDASPIYPFDVVVSNMDVVNTFRKLLPNAKQPERILRQPKSSSALIFYWGIKKSFAELGLHNIFFSNDYRTEFEYLFQKKTIYSDPTVYINITSKHKADDAPEGGENWFILVNAPNNEGQNWDELIDKTRRAVIQKITQNLGVDIGQLIECEAILDPRSIEAKTSSSQGALYGNSSNNRFAAFLRHANFSREFKNLYFVGGSVHPGGGIPLAILSAKIVADLLDS
jgi:diapolycopene oxygenase